MSIIPPMTFWNRSVSVLGLLSFMIPLTPGACVTPLHGQEPESRVHAILFYSRTCPHCHQLITEFLIPLQNQYGDRLAVLGLETTQGWANSLYYEAIRHFKIPEEDWVVPILIVDDEILVGGNEIPARLPAIIEEGLASGGIDLPDFPALITFLQEQDALDPRFPDRRILRPSPSPEEAADSAPGPELPGEAGDSAPVMEVPEETPDSAPVMEAPEETPDSTPAAELPEETADSALAVEAPEEDPDSLRGRAERQEPLPDSARTQGAAEEGVSPAQADAPEARPDAPPGSQPSGGGLGGLDLRRTARDLESMGMMDRFMIDPVGGSLAVLVLIAMLLTLVLRGYPPRVHGAPWPEWVIPALVVLGAVVASYLSFVEVSDAEAVCGPVGDCNTVNQSEYATLFGVIPVGVFGLVGYGVILCLWIIRQAAEAPMRRWATLGIWAAAVIGTLFSVYLTFLEPFVIGATCLWCLTSALVITLILWAVAPIAAGVWEESGTPGQTPGSS